MNIAKYSCVSARARASIHRVCSGFQPSVPSHRSLARSPSLLHDFEPMIDIYLFTAETRWIKVDPWIFLRSRQHRVLFPIFIVGTQNNFFRSMRILRQTFRTLPSSHELQTSRYDNRIAKSSIIRDLYSRYAEMSRLSSGYSVASFFRIDNLQFILSIF